MAQTQSRKTQLPAWFPPGAQFPAGRKAGPLAVGSCLFLEEPVPRGGLVWRRPVSSGLSSSEGTWSVLDAEGLGTERPEAFLAEAITEWQGRAG